MISSSLHKTLPLVLALLLPATLSAAEGAAYNAAGADGIRYEIQPGAGGAKIVSEGGELKDATVFVALGSGNFTGSFLVPYEKGVKGSTVFLPFKARAVLYSSPSGAFWRKWESTKWSDPIPADGAFTAKREGKRVEFHLSPELTGPAEQLAITAYAKDLATNEGWGRLFGQLDPAGKSGPGDILVRRYAAWNTPDGKPVLRTKNNTDLSKVRIYQMLPRLFGNTNETRKPNGFIEENGSGKFADLDETALGELKKAGFTHVWVTGVLQQATATDYSAIGEPADDPDLLKGLAGSPYAIKDYFDVSPDYAIDPARRLDEFKEMVARVHAAGMKVLIDFVPNHVARSYHSTIRPDLSFGENDDRSKFFSADNNFFWLTRESNAYGDGPPLKLPTVDNQGRPASPTTKVAKAPSDGLFEPEKEHGRVTGNNLASWTPDYGSWYETVKLNYGFDFTDPAKSRRLYPHGDLPDLAIPDTWKKMDEIIAYWQGLGVDGFRVDMAHMVPPEFWHWMIGRAKTREPGAFFVAEAYDTDPGKVPGGDPLVVDVGGGNVMFDLLNAGFDAVYDDATYDKLKELFDAGAWANDLDRITAHPFVFDNSLRYAENHDEVRLAAKGHWGNLGMNVGRPVTALLFALSRGPAMLYHGQEVGEPAHGDEGFGTDDARTSIFDYWSMPEFTKWVNAKKFDGGRLSEEQKSLRDFYVRLVPLINEPAFRNGDFFPLNPANVENPNYARVPGEQASGHWTYSFLRRDPVGGQAFLVVVNLHPEKTFQNVEILLPEAARDFLKATPDAGGFSLSEKLRANPKASAGRFGKERIVIDSIPPLTPLFFEISSPSQS